MLLYLGLIFVHIDNNIKDILILGEEPAQGLDNNGINERKGFLSVKSTKFIGSKQNTLE